MTSPIRDRGDDDVPLNTIFQTLSHATRRHILTTLNEHQLDHSNPISTNELTPPGSTNQRFHASLYHHHLPYLDAIGFIDWNPDTKTITPGPTYDAIHPVITLLESNPDHLPADWP